jgi:hypothetical protein
MAVIENKSTSTGLAMLTTFVEENIIPEVTKVIQIVCCIIL